MSEKVKMVSEMNEEEVIKEQEKLLKKYWETNTMPDIVRAYELGRRVGALTLTKK